MAAGSAAAAKQRLVEAEYRTGQAQHDLRCDLCRHCQPAARMLGGKQHGRYCALHKAAVKTHGVCCAFGHRKPGEAS